MDYFLFPTQHALWQSKNYPGECYRSMGSMVTVMGLETVGIHACRCHGNRDGMEADKSEDGMERSWEGGRVNTLKGMPWK